MSAIYHFIMGWKELITKVFGEYPLAGALVTFAAIGVFLQLERPGDRGNDPLLPVDRISSRDPCMPIDDKEPAPVVVVLLIAGAVVYQPIRSLHRRPEYV